MENKQTFPLLLISILIGVAIGLLYGWVINPIQSASCTPDTFRSNYQTDYILMTAESFAGDQDLTLARDRLALLSPRDPANSVQSALNYAHDNRFPEEDLELLERLLNALTSQNTKPTQLAGEQP
ncbi:MAG: hypothetical protein JXA25_09330 [Anaerolineales bacterium]|nr:hypothetical protein [Anaerolineales bacterium]